MTTRCAQDPLCCGPFTAGEVPDPLAYSFLRADGSPIPLGGFTTSFCWSEKWGGAEARPAQLTDAQGGTVTYAWQPGDLDTPGQYTGLFWATDADGAPRYASVPIRFDVHWPACQVVAA
jgi:hypothetical protein